MVVTTKYVGIPNARLWTARQGEGPALVLCHGGPGTWDDLGPVADMVDDLSTVYRYDQRACGRSSGVPPFDVASAVANLEALREHWELPQWIVGGHSWGATLALAYCLHYPNRAKALIYLSGTGIDPAWHAEYHSNMAARLSPAERTCLASLKERLSHVQGAERTAVSRKLCELVWSTDFAEPIRGRELARSLLIDGLAVNDEVNRVLGKDGRRFAESADMPERLAELRIPTLVIHGEADPRPAWSARTLAKCLPNATLVVLPAVGHIPWLEQPDLLRNALRSFLARVWARGTTTSISGEAIPPVAPD